MGELSVTREPAQNTLPAIIADAGEKAGAR